MGSHDRATPNALCVKYFGVDQLLLRCLATRIQFRKSGT